MTRIARRRAEEEGGDMLFVPERRRSRRLTGAIRTRDVRAADLQEEPTKRAKESSCFVDGRVVGSDEDGGSPVDIAASGASHWTERALASGAIKHGELVTQVTPAAKKAAALRGAVEATLSDFLAKEAVALEFADPALGALASLARSYVLGCGKRLRPTFAYWGWRSIAGVAPELETVLPAFASLELLHAFALAQDDVMDGSATRRGRPTAHQVLAAEHTAAGRAGSAGRFGSAGAVLLGDLLLVWADRMQLHANVSAGALLAARRHYDEMRIDTIAGQYLDVLSDAESDAWSVERALRVARLKTASYTVTGPLLLGAALADGGPPAPVADAYRTYGAAVGEAFQLRDDLLGVFGDPGVTGKPAGDDLLTGKPTVLLLTARRMATATQRAALCQPPLDADDVDRLAGVVAETGAVAAIEVMVERRAMAAIDALGPVPIDPAARSALTDLAITATYRRA